jgi:hypothetical protein
MKVALVRFMMDTFNDVHSNEHEFDFEYDLAQTEVRHRRSPFSAYGAKHLYPTDYIRPFTSILTSALQTQEEGSL